MSDYIATGSQVSSIGIVQSLFGNSTFKPIDAFIELYHNSCDAGSSNTTYEIIKHKNNIYLKCQDNGSGMTLKTMDRSLKLLESDIDLKRHGRWNYGGKAAVLFLSGLKDFYNKLDPDYNGDIICLSKNNNDGKISCYVMNGKTILENGWNSNIMPYDLLDSRAPRICDELSKEYSIEGDSGTHFYIQLTDNKYEELSNDEVNIKNDIQQKWYKELINTSVSISLKLDKPPQHIEFKDILKWDSIPNEKKCEYKINVYVHNNKKYVISFVDKYGTEKAYLPHGKGYKKDLQIIENNYKKKYLSFKGDLSMKFVCHYTYIKDNGIPEPKNNYNRLARSGTIVGLYNSPYLDSNCGDFHKRGTNYHSNGIIEYTGKDNLDAIFGINMNKSLFNQNAIDPNFKHILEHLHKNFADKCFKYIDKVEYKRSEYNLNKALNDFNNEKDNNKKDISKLKAALKKSEEDIENCSPTLISKSKTAIYEYEDAIKKKEEEQKEKDKEEESEEKDEEEEDEDEDDGDEEEEEEEEEEEDVKNKQVIKIEDPIKRKQGPGTQIRQTKENVEKILNNKISVELNKLEGNERKSLENDICICLYKIISEKNNPKADIHRFQNDMAKKLGFEKMREIYYDEVLSHKLSQDEVAGGSLLSKFINENFKPI